MPIQVLMPALSPTMTEGKLAKWLKREGDSVQSGDVLAEIETDKATMEVEAVDEGTLGKILVAEGSEGVAVNTPIALLLEEGEDASALDAEPTAPPPPPSKPSAKEPPAERSPEPASKPQPGRPEPSPKGAAKRQPGRPEPSSGERVFASPLARRLAAETGLDLAKIRGSGPHGRIIKVDIEAAAKAPEAAAKAPPAEAAEAAPGGYTEVANTTMRKVIAKRLSESKRDIPHYYLSVDCRIDALIDLRQQLNRRAPELDPEFRKLSVNDFVVRAVALALRAYPEANSSWGEEAIRLYQDVDVCVAVATPNGLVTPVIRNADRKGLAAIAKEIHHLAGRARDGKLMPEDYQGGGFTVSNLGMYGITEFAAIINPPQSCILAVGAAEQRPIVKDGALAIGTVMTCTLSADHRSVDGAKGAEFLSVFKRLVEDPLTMLL